ncbi:Endoplasmic reticulum junction formation protein lunapark like [Verticillium longisporum]|uniref:Endoplasmic reticulum junction formation protein lunapark n=1 Tax=Verticillium longisporum TaxID=100787 RepID=A0A8I3A2I9_VERLO|nr:Endoplasmic reticulum junction formation protein lunapark like [Verticillium longisporum]
MVSFWPWRGDDSSPASFEKALSALSTKIADSQARLERARATSRRVRVLWTLYLSFGYLIYAIVQILVVGTNNMRTREWAGVAGGPVIIFLTRTVVTLYFNFRIERLSVRLKEQQDERAKTIQKLKDATKYDSTMQLLEKYGGENKTDKDGKKADGSQQNPGSKQQNEQQQQQGQHGNGSGRTALPPPPTANIQRRNGPVGVATHGTQQSGHGDPRSGAPAPLTGLEPSAEFAPNAYAQQPPQHYAQQAELTTDSSHWYDRIMDLLLGEDETAPKNRVVLICRNCRLVNGQAPPGTKSLAELGMWKCMSCGAANGEVDEGKRIVDEVLRSKETTSEVTAGEEFKEEDDSEEETPEMVQVGKDEVGPEGQASGKHTASGTRKRKGKKG